MAKPSYIFRWCEDETDSDGNLSRIQPPPEVELTGTLIRQPIFRLWNNEMQYNFSSWIQYLAEEKELIGSVNTTLNGVFANDAEASAQWGGTWEYITTTSVGSEFLDYYKKIAL